MRYMAEAAAEDYGDDGGNAPAVVACVDGLDERQALRHARAMLEVQRAANAWAVAARAMERSYERDELCSAAAPKVQRHLAATTRLLKAHDRLKRIEKEVERGE